MAIRKEDAITDLESVKRYIGVTGTADDRLIDSLTLSACIMVQNFLNTKVVRQTHTKERHNGRGYTTLMLRHYPVVEVERVAVDVDDVMTVEYGSTDASHARVWVTGNAVKLRKIVSGVTTNNTFAFSDYATIDLLATGIDAVSNWDAVVGDSFTGYPTSELLSMPAWTAKDKKATLSMPDETDIDVQIQHEEWGIIYNPYGFSKGHANIIVDYVAGWNPIPAPIESAVWELCKTMWSASQRDFSMKREKIGDYEYELAADPGNVFNEEDKEQASLILAKLVPYRRVEL